MELLEREVPLAALTAACREASKGLGSVVLVTGEPGIGKTALVSRFAADLGQDARVLWGTCDDLSVPRPLGPFRDLAVAASASLQEALSSEAPPHRIHSLILEELERHPWPTVLVIDDVHWADEATLDAITFIGRRIAAHPAVLILTYRIGEVDPAHPLHSALGALRSDTSLYLQLAPLSLDAVATLAGAEAGRIYAATSGNPFYVTEMLGTQPTALPPSVASAVLGSYSRLNVDSRRLVELVSMVPSKMPTDLLDAVMPHWSDAAEEPERRQLLSVSPSAVHFRHELTRIAIRSAVPASRRRSLHAGILNALLAIGAYPADIVHHAEAAGDFDVVATYALVAARQAAAVESNREAYSHYRRAAEFADRLPPQEKALLFEEVAVAAYTVDRVPEALTTMKTAIRIYRQIGDEEASGRCTRLLSRFHWYAGDGVAAMGEAHSAIRILEPLGDSVELARAYSGLSQLAMLGARAEETLAWGSRAVDLAERLNADAVKVHAMVNIGTIRMQANPGDTAMLLEAHQLADTIGERHEAVRAVLNLGYTAISWIQPVVAWQYTRMAIDYAEEHQVDTLLLYAKVMSAWLYLRAGNWEETERICRGEVDTSDTSVARLLAKMVLAELAVRRGDLDADERLEDLAGQVERTGELQRIGPLLQLATERALTTGAPMPLERFARAQDLIHSAMGWAETTVAAWAAVAGYSIQVDGIAPDPHAAMLEHNWSGAADAFGNVGWIYDRGLMLSLSDDETALAEAIDIARRLGAKPLEERVGHRMRELGMTVPHGPRQSTQANPAGLTSRQLEVLELLVEGLTNAEIAQRLFVSPRTTEHHVEAILTKLGVSNRREAARRYVEMEIGPSRTSPT